MPAQHKDRNYRGYNHNRNHSSSSSKGYKSREHKTTNRHYNHRNKSSSSEKDYKSRDGYKNRHQGGRNRSSSSSRDYKYKEHKDHNYHHQRDNKYDHSDRYYKRSRSRSHDRGNYRPDNQRNSKYSYHPLPKEQKKHFQYNSRQNEDNNKSLRFKYTRKDDYKDTENYTKKKSDSPQRVETILPLHRSHTEHLNQVKDVRYGQKSIEKTYERNYHQKSNVQRNNNNNNNSQKIVLEKNNSERNYQQRNYIDKNYQERNNADKNERQRYNERNYQEKNNDKGYQERNNRDKPSYQQKNNGERSYPEKNYQRINHQKTYQEKPHQEKPYQEKPYQEKTIHQEKPYQEKPYQEKPYQEKPYQEKPYQEIPYQQKPTTQEKNINERNFQEKRQNIPNPLNNSYRFKNFPPPPPKVLKSTDDFKKESPEKKSQTFKQYSGLPLKTVNDSIRQQKSFFLLKQMQKMSPLKRQMPEDKLKEPLQIIPKQKASKYQLTLQQARHNLSTKLPNSTFLLLDTYRVMNKFQIQTLDKRLADNLKHDFQKYSEVKQNLMKKMHEQSSSGSVGEVTLRGSNMNNYYFWMKQDRDQNEIDLRFRLEQFKQHNSSLNDLLRRLKFQD